MTLDITSNMTSNVPLDNDIDIIGGDPTPLSKVDTLTECVHISPISHHNSHKCKTAQSPPLPPYDDIPVSVYTFFAKSNVYFNLDDIHKQVVCQNQPDCIKWIKYTPEVSKKTIHTVSINCRGDISDSDKYTPNLLHACTICFLLTEKAVNVKLYKTGTMHITGCKSIEQCCRAVFGVFKVIHTTCAHNIYKKVPNEPFEFIINAVMKNLHFNLGFKINRERFLRRFSTLPDIDYVITYEDQANAGINLKKLISHIKTDTMTRMIIDEAAAGYTQTLCEMPVSYKPTKSITFILFYSGICRYSGCNERVMRESYDEFVSTLVKYRNDIESDAVVICNRKK